MERQNVLNVRINADERRVISALAEHLGVSQSDAVRLTLRETARHLGLLPTKPLLAPAREQTSG